MAPVLIAEDSQLLAALLRDAFVAQGVSDEVKVYKDGHAFLAAYAESLARGHAVRLLILDIAMPGLDGLSAGRQIRRIETDSGAAPVPIVFFSALEEDDDVKQAVTDCFPARFVPKTDEGGPAKVALTGAKLIRGMLQGAGR